MLAGGGGLVRIVELVVAGSELQSERGGGVDFIRSLVVILCVHHDAKAAVLPCLGKIGLITLLGFRAGVIEQINAQKEQNDKGDGNNKLVILHSDPHIPVR